jgi:hypothetical protein
MAMYHKCLQKPKISVLLQRTANCELYIVGARGLAQYAAASCSTVEYNIHDYIRLISN